jgi:hypothetical protein
MKENYSFLILLEPSDFAVSRGSISPKKAVTINPIGDKQDADTYILGHVQI